MVVNICIADEDFILREFTSTTTVFLYFVNVAFSAVRLMVVYREIVTIDSFVDYMISESLKGLTVLEVDSA